MDKNKELFKKVEARLHNYKYLQIQIDNLELDIEEIKNDYRGCGSISYDERTGSTYNISRTIEDEIHIEYVIIDSEGHRVAPADLNVLQVYVSSEEEECGKVICAWCKGQFQVPLAAAGRIYICNYMWLGRVPVIDVSVLRNVSSFMRVAGELQRPEPVNGKP